MIAVTDRERETETETETETERGRGWYVLKKKLNHYQQNSPILCTFLIASHLMLEF